MRILHLTNHVQEIGNGIVNVAVDLAHGQAASGHEVLFASEGGEYEALLERGGVVHHRLATPGPSFDGIRGVVGFYQALRRFRPEVVHSHMVKWAFVARVLAPFFGYRTVSTVHNVYQKSSRAMGFSDAVIALGEASRNIIVGWGVPPERVHTVLNAPLGSPRLASYPDGPAHLDGAPAIVSIGGLFLRKGFAPLVAAMPAILERRPDAVLHIVGEGPDRPVFESLASKVGGQAVRFHGFQANPRSFLAAADIVVLASYRESFPLVLLEAREFGTRIVATDVDGNREALDGGTAGTLVPAGDPGALARGILGALEAPVPHGVGEGLDRFRVPALVSATDRIYRAIAAKR